MNWQIEKGVRCDLYCYAAKNLSGKFSPVQIFPAGNRKGDVKGSELRSMVVRAHYGTRIVLITEAGNEWESHPWRCIRLREDSSLEGEGRSMPGVRIPDLDLLDGHGAKRTNLEVETTYPHADSLDAGEGWTFGRIGELKGQVTLIRVEKDRVRAARELPEPDLVARAVFERLHERDPAAAAQALADVSEALHRVLVDAGHADAQVRVRELETWARSL